MGMDSKFIPNPLNSDRQFARFCHHDVAYLTDYELKDEINALRPHLWGLPNDNWLRERVAQLEDELVKRRGGKTDRYTKHPKFKPADGVIL
jgi:hypothetical protein